jgi:toxin CcdB
MAQFDVYTNPSKKSKAYYPYLVDVQNNYISELETRIVIPLGRASYFENEIMTKLQIKLAYEDQDLVLMTPQISSISRSSLKEPVGSLQHLQQEIIDALDFAITGI